MNLPVFSIQYFGNIHYYYTIAQYPKILIETQEYYIKQTYRNRTYILTANGIMPLIIPVIHQSSKEKIADKKISYKEKWYKKHYTAILSAYKNAPYFEHYADELLSILLKPTHQYLLEFNLHIIKKVLQLLHIPTQIEFSSQCHHHYTYDYRNYFENNSSLPQSLNTPYLQVFSDRMEFQKNLCILDLIFNLGPESMDYVRK